MLPGMVSYCTMTQRQGLAWIITAFLAGVVSVFVALRIDSALLQSADEPAGDQGTGTSPHPARTSFSAAVANAAPAVVNIYTTKFTTERRPQAFRDPRMQYYYGRMLPDTLHKHKETSLGSGVILTADGLLLTNRHIIKDADEIRVVLAEGRSLDVSVVGFDPETDLAVLKANATGLPAITVGRPQSLRVGDVVLAIGNPFGIGQTVTMGIVSATGRSHLGLTSIEDFIQTDAAINPGNSGGALVDAQGRLVGINTAIYSESGGSQGVGFAIPADLATKVMSQVAAKGRVERGWIGISGLDVTPDLAESFGLRVNKGVLVESTLKESPAEQAGLRPGDVISALDKRRIDTIRNLIDAVADAGPNSQVTIEVWRGSQRISTTATTTWRPAISTE